MSLSLAQLSQLFAQAFAAQYRTLLVGGFSEPFYLAPKGEAWGEIRYRDDYFSSALHELAHWCLVGPGRLAQDDYGYWYQGERDLAAQQRFEQFEARPQALEWLLHLACGLEFRPSADNLSYPDYDLGPFSRRIEQQAKLLLERLPPRAAILISKLDQACQNSLWPVAQQRVQAGLSHCLC